VRHDYIQSKLQTISAIDVDNLNKDFAVLRDRAREEFMQEGFAEDEVELLQSLDLRYVGQGYELTLPTPTGPLTADQLRGARSSFDQMHSRLFGHKAENRPVEVVNYRVNAIVRTKKIQYPSYAPSKQSVDAARKGKRDVHFSSSEGTVSCPVYDRAQLAPGHKIVGPAIVEQMDSTTVVYPRHVVEVDTHGNLLITTSVGKARLS
jgi:N-methylhydantoinase A